jgi:hypothetical protein
MKKVEGGGLAPWMGGASIPCKAAIGGDDGMEAAEMPSWWELDMCLVIT